MVDVVNKNTIGSFYYLAVHGNVLIPAVFDVDATGCVKCASSALSMPFVLT